jgi:hypothetical protein
MNLFHVTVLNPNCDKCLLKGWPDKEQMKIGWHQRIKK